MLLCCLQLSRGLKRLLPEIFAKRFWDSDAANYYSVLSVLDGGQTAIVSNDGDLIVSCSSSISSDSETRPIEWMLKSAISLRKIG